jgi:transcriptional regulator with GAF, ATPase, and Fis domain
MDPVEPSAAGPAPAQAVDPAAMRAAAFGAVSAAFGSLGRVCMALDQELRIRHLSPELDRVLGAGAVDRYRGRPIADLVGPELFGDAGPLRAALLAGERREGWRASLRVEPSGSRLVSLSAAPLRHDAGGACDPEAAFLVVLRPAEEDPANLGAAPTSFGGLIARSRAMTRILRQIAGLQHSDATLLLTGESGTGKGVLAHAVHAHSLRRDGPFVAVNCAALPDALLESELFGHVRGAFTGAVRDRVGRFEAASGGTLFLDEVGDLPLHLQAKLLRVLQERTFERVGESTSLTTDVRLVAATHRDLRAMVERGTFREDLYYRLRVFPIEIPPLRARREDVEPISRFLLARACARTGREVRFSPDALRALLDYPWPGNVRELENAIEYAVTVARGQTLLPEDLPPEVLAGDGGVAGGAKAAAQGRLADAAGPSAGAGGRDGEREEPAGPRLHRRAAPPPRDQITAALDAHHWRIAESSRALGVSRTTLWRWMRELGLAR